MFTIECEAVDKISRRSAISPKRVSLRSFLRSGTKHTKPKFQVLILKSNWEHMHALPTDGDVDGELNTVEFNLFYEWCLKE